MTPREIDLRLEAKHQEQRRQLELAAWHVTPLINLHLDRKDKIKSHLDLIREPDAEEQTEWSEADFDNLWEKIEENKRKKAETE